MSYRKTVDGITIGFALFAMFFGAGNLILPPFLGINAGGDWGYSMAGFTLTAIIAPFLGILAVVRSGNSFIDLGKRINKTIIIILGIVIMVSLGPGVALPRTAATTFELGVLTVFPDFSPIVSSICFFSIVFLLSISPSNIVDIIGRFLTPILLIILTMLIILGIVYPLDTNLLDVKQSSNAFYIGFSEGYQTLDALASVIFANIIILSTISKGYKTVEEKTNISLIAGGIAMVCLFFVYGGLEYLGSTSGYSSSEELNRTNLLLYISKGILGSTGAVSFALCVAVACLTTAIALTCAVATFFSELTNGLLSYRFIVILCCILSCVLAVNGVDDIIKYAAPFLAFIYPIVLTIIFYIVLAGRFVKRKAPFIGAIIATTIISTIEFVEFILVEIIVDERNRDMYIGIVKNIKSYIPLSQYNLSWVVPSLVFFVLFFILDMVTKKE